MLLLDANLLVLLIVGLTSRDLIGTHKRTRAFALEDLDLLIRFVERFRLLAVTPNLLTEAANLCRQVAEPARSRIMATFARLASAATESHVPSALACEHPEFARLGLSDVVTLQVGTSADCILTTDLDLYLSLLTAQMPVQNFNHLRKWS